MSHVFVSKDHTDLNDHGERSYSFVHDAGLTSGGYVSILAFNEGVLVDGPAGKIPKKLGELKVHKDALTAFVASMVRDARIDQLESMNDMGAFGL